MKKIPILLLLTLISNFVFVPSRSSFATIEENGTTWWSVEELLDFYPEVEAEKDAECGDDQDCRMEFNFSMIEKGEKYRALNNLIETQFWVTSINPVTETIKVLFFDEDMMLRHMGIEEKLEIEHLFIGWFENWVGQIYNYDHNSFTNGSIPGVHILYDSTVEDPTVIIPWQENELPMFEPNISDNVLGKLDYAIFAKENKFNAQGAFDYSNCIKSSDYEPGLECKMYISADHWVAYFPPRNEIEPKEPTSQNPSTDNTPSDSEPTPPVEESLVVEQPIIDRGTELSEESREDSVSNEATLSLAPDIKAPNTGIGSCDRAVEFPWWFMLMLLIGDIVALWLFWPTKSKKSRKNV